MGVPALFRWLSQKYPKIISGVIEEQPREVEGEYIPVDTTGPNPNGEEMDNLYLDMNGIVHPCSHPEDRPPPATEEEMMLEIFKYTDRVVNMVRPRKLLMIAVDGVAPRAKMNQQRSRRFRSAQEAKEKDEKTAEFMKLLQKQNAAKGDPADVIQAIEPKKTWDSNAITPGTPFMGLLAAALRYWVAYKLNTDPAWEKVKIIISDATVPGEGEHKIMEFIRSQRNSPQHDPNTRHVIYGLDADLIMLGLATHEPHFRVLREDVFFQEGKQKTCRICGQPGHFAEACTGEVKQKTGEFDEKQKGAVQKPFIWLHVSILREYLEVEMKVPYQPFPFDLERALDDWVFMCFFVGNDFLPHLPSLDIREQGIDTLIAIWRDCIPIMGGYVTKDGQVDLERAQMILQGLAKQEDSIFKRRKQVDDRRKAADQRRKQEAESRKRQKRGANGNGNEGDFGDAQQGPRRKNAKVVENFDHLPSFNPNDVSTKAARQLTHDMIMRKNAEGNADTANKSAAAVLKERLLKGKSLSAAETPTDTDSEPISQLNVDTDSDALNLQTPPSALKKRKADLMEEEEAGTPGRKTPNYVETPKEEPEEPEDEVRLWSPGYADRYYEAKFKVDPKDLEFRHQVARAYTEGLAWVLLYYFQGCPSWTWYYPYHYAPFAADFVDIADMEINFEKGKPFRPYEQLMGVMPAASNHTIPVPFRSLMTDEDSDIVHFYPEDFPIDLNGKKFAWQGVAILPFIDEKKLLAAMDTKYPLLSDEEHERNAPGHDVLLFSTQHPLYEDVAVNFYSKKQGAPKLSINPRTSEGLAGKIEKNEAYIPSSSLVYPLGEGMPDLEEDRSISVNYEMPKFKNSHKSMLLRGVKFNPPVLDSADIEATRNRASRSGRSFGGVPLRNDYNENGGRRISYAPNDRRDDSYRPRGGYNNGPGNRNDGYDNRQNRYDDRPNPFAAHINPQFAGNLPPGFPPPPVNGWVPPPPHLASGFPPPPPAGYQNGGYYPPPPPGMQFPGYPQGGAPHGQGQQRQDRDSYRPYPRDDYQRRDGRDNYDNRSGGRGGNQNGGYRRY